VFIKNRYELAKLISSQVKFGAGMRNNMVSLMSFFCQDFV